jgi:hypothetical protein
MYAYDMTYYDGMSYATIVNPKLRRCSSMGISVELFGEFCEPSSFMKTYEVSKSK